MIPHLPQSGVFRTAIGRGVHQTGHDFVICSRKRQPGQVLAPHPPKPIGQTIAQVLNGTAQEEAQVDRAVRILEAPLQQQLFNVDAESGFFETLAHGAFSGRFTSPAFASGKLISPCQRSVRPAPADQITSLMFNDSNPDPYWCRLLIVIGGWLGRCQWSSFYGVFTAPVAPTPRIVESDVRHALAAQRSEYATLRPSHSSAHASALPDNASSGGPPMM